MTTPTANPRVVALFPFLRPTTLAAVAADVQANYAAQGDPLADLLAFLAVNALESVVGAQEAAQMIQDAEEESA